MTTVESEASQSPLERYFAAVDVGDFDAALGLFSSTCIYARPPLRSSDRANPGRFETLVGGDAIRTFLEARGKIPLTHDIHTTMIDEHQCFVEGIASFTERSSGNDTLFMAHADLDASGLICRFLALSTVIDAAGRRIVVPRH